MRRPQAPAVKRRRPGVAAGGVRTGIPAWAGRPPLLGRSRRFTGSPARITLAARSLDTAEPIMSKGMDQKKQDKKKPEKTLKEKRAEKKEKKAGK
jgi:hypothetical protein